MVEISVGVNALVLGEEIVKLEHLKDLVINLDKSLIHLD